MIEKHRELFEYAETIVKRYCRFYNKQYLNNSISFDDLMQEASIVVSHLLKKIESGLIFNKDKIKLNISNAVEVKRFIGNAVGRRMNIIRIHSKRKNLGSITGDKVCQCPRVTRGGDYSIDIDGYCILCGLPIGRKMDNSIEIEDDNYVMSNNNAFEIKDEKLQLTVEEMAEICFRHPQIKENDFRMFCEKFIEDKTYKEVGDRYNVSRQRVRQKIERVISVLKKYYEK